MQSNPIKALLTVIVLSSGFISCSQDKGVVYTQDEFQPDVVSAENSDKSVFVDGDIRSLDAGGKLRFDSLAKYDFAQESILFTIESTCLQEGLASPAVSRIDFQNQKEIEVIKLLPSEILSSLSPQQPICDIKITTRKETSASSNINELKAVSIAKMLEYSNSDLGILDSDRISANELYTRSFSFSEKGSLFLSCTDFKKSAVGVSGAVEVERLSMFDAEVINRLSNWAQTCRMVFKGPNEVLISRVFTLDFPIAPPTITGTIVRVPIHSHFKNPKVLELSVGNRNSFPIQVKLTKKTKSRYKTRPLYMANNGTQIGREQHAVMVWSVLSPDAKETNDEITFTIPGNESVTVEAVAQREMICDSSAPQSILDVNPAAPALKYGIKKLINTYYAGNNFDYNIASKFLFKSGTDTWEEQEDILIEGTSFESKFSDLPYWTLPTTEQIQKVFGKEFSGWNQFLEVADVCNG